METSELNQLVQQAQAGDPRALEDLLAYVQPVVLRRCSKFLPYRYDAEEAAQEALMTISQKIDSYSGRGSFLGWVTVIASNTARGAYRTMKRRFAESNAVPLPDNPDPRTTSVIAGTRLDVLDALDKLERDHPAVVESFVLRDFGALSYDEIAAMTDVPLGTAKARIHTARAYLRDALGNERLG